MLVNNFSAGIIGGGMALIGVWIIGPVVRWFTNNAESAVDWLVTNDLLPLASVLVEPGKVLFLNNAINHGVLDPLGVAESAAEGQSILFMIETNPGPGLGLLLAYLMFGPRLLRPTVPAAIVIQFLGGIHEIYFPYVLMKPRLILAMIAGGAAVTQAWLQIASVTIMSLGGLLVAWSLSNQQGWLGSLGRVAGISIPGAFAFSVTRVTELVFLDWNSFGARTVLVSVQVFGLLWIIFGPPLVLRVWGHRSHGDEPMPVGAAIQQVPDRMTRYQRLMVLGTSFTGIATIVAVLLERWL